MFRSKRAKEQNNKVTKTTPKHSHTTLPASFNRLNFALGQAKFGNVLSGL